MIFSGSLTSQIPLPDMPEPSAANLYSPHAHLITHQHHNHHHPLMNIPIPPSILKKTSAYAVTPIIPTLAPNKEPPGVPPYPPADLDSEDEEFLDRVKFKTRDLFARVRVRVYKLTSPLSNKKFCLEF